jgi:hypothetical protein
MRAGHRERARRGNCAELRNPGGVQASGANTFYTHVLNRGPGGVRSPMDSL